MCLKEWARKVVAAVHCAPDERAPVDAVLVNFIDEFDEIARRTKLKIPAFARALDEAGLKLASGMPYDGDTLRVQLHRARRKIEAQRQSSRTDEIAKDSSAGSKSSSVPQSREDAIYSATDSRETALNNEVNQALSRLKSLTPKKPRSLID